MSFLFKSKKSAAPPPSSLPAAARNLHTSDGTTSAPNAPKESLERSTQSPAPVGPGGSNGALQSEKTSQLPQQIVRRERSESEVGVRNNSKTVCYMKADVRIVTATY